MLIKQLSCCRPKPRPPSPGDLDDTLMFLYWKQILMWKKSESVITKYILIKISSAQCISVDVFSISFNFNFTMWNVKCIYNMLVLLRMNVDRYLNYLRVCHNTYVHVCKCTTAYKNFKILITSLHLWRSKSFLTMSCFAEMAIAP